MSRIVSMIVIASTFLAVAGIESQASAQDWAEKMFSSLEHNFQDLARGAEAEHRFTITNLYKEDIHILSVGSSCGCTAPRVTKSTIKSGETAELIAKFDTVKFKGAHDATVTVTFDQPTFAEVRLQINGFVRRDVVFKPGQIEIGTVDSGKSVEKQVSVQYAGRSDWEIIDIEGSTSHFEVEMSEKQGGGSQSTYNLTVRLKDSAPEGHIDDLLTLVTNDPQRSRIPLPVRGYVRPSVSVSPSSLQIGKVKPGTKVTKQLVVRGSTPFKIASVSCADDCFEFKTTGKAKKLHRIPVTFTAGDKIGKFIENIEIKLDGKETTLPSIVAHFEVAAE